MVDVLLQNGANIKGTNHRMETPLHVATGVGIVRALMNHNPCIDSLDEVGALL